MQQSGAKARQNRNHALREKRARDLATCQAKGKRKYPDVVAAREGAGQTMQRRGWVLYPYLCVCGFWHLTSQVPDTTKDDWFYGDLADEVFIAKGLADRLT